MKALVQSDGSYSGTKIILTTASLIILAKFGFATTPEMISAVGSSGAQLLGALGLLYVGRGAVKRMKDNH